MGLFFQIWPKLADVDVVANGNQLLLLRNSVFKTIFQIEE